jgi:hypothetical protein
VKNGKIIFLKSQSDKPGYLNMGAPKRINSRKNSDVENRPSMIPMKQPSDATRSGEGNRYWVRWICGRAGDREGHGIDVANDNPQRSWVNPGIGMRESLSPHKNKKNR